MDVTNLDRPLPVAGVHLIIDEARSLSVYIVPFRSVDKVTCKIGVTKEGLNRQDNFTIMKFKVFATNTKIYALKAGWAR